jgi:hypothetical protein
MLDMTVEIRSLGDDAPMAWGRTALHMAVGSGGARDIPKNWSMTKRFVKVMLEEGADPNAYSEDPENQAKGCTPFHSAVLRG